MWTPRHEDLRAGIVDLLNSRECKCLPSYFGWVITACTTSSVGLKGRICGSIALLAGLTPLAETGFWK